MDRLHRGGAVLCTSASDNRGGAVFAYVPLDTNLLLRPEEGLDPAETWPRPVELEHSGALGSAPG